MKDVRQGCALAGALATGHARCREVGRQVRGELADHGLQVVADRASEVLQADDVPVAVELDLGQDALDDPLDKVGKACRD